MKMGNFLLHKSHASHNFIKIRGDAGASPRGILGTKTWSVESWTVVNNLNLKKWISNNFLGRQDLVRQQGDPVKVQPLALLLPPPFPAHAKREEQPKGK